ncbi:DUF805 domain-containing protein [Dyella sp. Tek66A03]|jgi:uncharacterized membrane protein YhaH (DUF805 family)|uniref:DUF805 domain-containing protein n=1 Tax=Dyella sp. Tek66A03 TaxID=3458298 RepID=UPI00403E43E3
MEWYLKVLKGHYADFNGRARRKEYWMFTLVNVIVSFVLGLVCGLIHVPWLAYIYALAVMVPSIAVAARRLHDVGKSGWFMLISFIPLAGLYLIYVLAQDGEAGNNAYGPNPKRAA